MCCSSLEMIVGLESNSKIFTVAVQGLLELQVSRRRLRRVATWRFCITALPSSPAGRAVHLHICGQRGRRSHHHPERIGLHGNAAGCVGSQHLWINGWTRHTPPQPPRRFEDRKRGGSGTEGDVENSEDCFLRRTGTSGE